MTESAINTHLPQEIVEEIICRIPMKAVNRFRCVSTSWNFFISKYKTKNTYFVFNTRDKMPRCSHKWLRACPIFSIPGTAQQDIRDVVITPLDQKDESVIMKSDVTVKTSYDGLLLLKVDQALSVYNPSSGTHIHVPNLPKKVDPHTYANMGFVYDLTNDDYKISAYSENVPDDEQGLTAELWIYSLKCMSWRSVGDFPKYFVPYGGCVSMSSAVHCLAFDTSRDYGSPLIIVSFEMGSSEFKITNVPRLVETRKTKQLALIVLRGMFCIYTNTNRCFRIWETPIYAAHKSWIEIFSIPLKLIWSETHLDKVIERFCKPLYQYENGEILIMAASEVKIKLMMCKDGTILHEDVIPRNSLSHRYMLKDIIVHEGSLCSANLS